MNHHQCGEMKYSMIYYRMGVKGGDTSYLFNEKTRRKKKNNY